MRGKDPGGQQGQSLSGHIADSMGRKQQQKLFDQGKHMIRLVISKDYVGCTEETNQVGG